MITIDGYTPDDLFALLPGELDAILLGGRPVVVRAGDTAGVVECHRHGRLIAIDVMLDEGGEAMLAPLEAFGHRFARRGGFERIHWAIRGTRRSADGLGRALESRGFVARQVPDVGECHYLETTVQATVET